MKSLLFTFITVSVLVCSGMSCHHDIDPRYFKFINNSDTAIYYGLSFSYPDTNLNKIEDKPYSGKIALKVNSKDSSFITAAPLAAYPTLQLFIFEAHTIDSYPWDTIVKHYMVLKRYQLTKSDMEKMNWILTYQ
jgi:hypothetical protein